MVFGVRLDPLEKTAPQEPPVQLDRRDPQDPQDPLDPQDPQDPRELLQHPLLFHQQQSLLLNAARRVGRHKSNKMLLWRLIGEPVRHL